MALKMKNSISTSLGFILASCLLVVLGGGLITLLNQSSEQAKKQAEESVRETKYILLKSIHFAMGEGIDSAEPFASMFREISNIRDVRVTPTAVIDADREAQMDVNERDVALSHRSHFYY